MQIVNSKKILFAGLALFGFAVGWAVSAYNNQQTSPSKEGTKLANLEDPEPFVSDDSVASLQADSNGQTEGRSIHPDAEARLLELIYSESIDHQLTATRVIEYFELLSKDPERNPRRNKRLRDLLRNVPEISFALLDQFVGIEDQHIKTQLGISLMINNSMQRPFLEPKLIENIKQHENRSEMLTLLGDWGLQSKSNLQFLHDELSYFDDPNDRGSAIRAISGSSWVERSAIEPEMMQALNESMEQYRNSNYPEVRAAAVAAMGTIAPADYRQKLLASFEDSSELVRSEALQLYLNHPFKSSELEIKLFENLQDTSLDYKERFGIAYGLGRLEISAEQKKLVEKVQTELREQEKSLYRGE